MGDKIQEVTDPTIKEIEHKGRVEYELRIIRNFLGKMPKSYRKITPNWVVVMDILLSGTSKCGSGSCVQKCRELGIDPYSNHLFGIPDGFEKVSEICMNSGFSRQYFNKIKGRYQVIKFSEKVVYAKLKSPKPTV